MIEAASLSTATLYSFIVTVRLSLKRIFLYLTNSFLGCDCFRFYSIDLFGGFT